MRTHHCLYNNCSSEQSARNYYQHSGNRKWQQLNSKQRAFRINWSTYLYAPMGDPSDCTCFHIFF
ncbi:hypothetical protein YC2023_009653 [Brassica napus]